MNSRRSFLKALSAFSMFASLPSGWASGSGSRIIIVGGGVAGTRTAAYLKMSMPSLDITLFDIALNAAAKNRYRENSYRAIQNNCKPVNQSVLEQLDIKCMTEHIIHMDPVDKSVFLSNGKKYQADFLIVSPGVDFKWDYIDGLQAANENRVLHAWQHPVNDKQLWQQIQAMHKAGTVVISVPAAPYRFPQGPYQRATKIAAYLKASSPASKVLILDANETFYAKNPYLKQWQREFPTGMVEWVPASAGGVPDSVDIQKNTLVAGGEKIHAAVLNLIPAQQAGLVARQAELNLNSDWCQVSSQTLESKHYPNVYLPGDANNADLYNKTAVFADRHALKCAKHIKSILS